MSDENYEFEQQEAIAYRMRLFEVIALVSFLSFCLMIVLGVLSWVISGDVTRLARTAIILFIGVGVTLHVVGVWTDAEPPLPPLPDHPDMDYRNQEDQ